MDIIIQYERLLERRDLIRSSIKINTKEAIKLRKEIRKLNILHRIFSSIITSMREVVIQELRTVITPIVKHIFVTEDFSFDVKYQKVGNHHRYTPVIMDGDRVRIPKYDSGGGLIPILDFALRVAFLEFGSQKFEKVLFLDEPFGWLGNLSYRTTDIITKLSRKLGIQFIINTHDFSLLEFADKKWRVVKKNKISHVKEIKDGKLLSVYPD